MMANVFSNNIIFNYSTSTKVAHNPVGSKVQPTGCLEVIESIHFKYSRDTKYFMIKFAVRNAGYTFVTKKGKVCATHIQYDEVAPLTTRQDKYVWEWALKCLRSGDVTYPSLNTRCNLNMLDE